MNGFGMRLRSLREERKLTPEQMAEEINFTKSVIWSYELEKKEPSVRHVIRIADYFQVSTDYLLKGEKQEAARNTFHLDGKKTIEQHTFMVDGKKLTDEEIVDMIAFVKAKRLLKENNPHI